MFRDLNEKRENFFDRLHDILKQRASINAKRKSTRDARETKLYCKTLRKAFYRKVEEKRLGGALLQTKVGPAIIVASAVLLLWGKFISHSLITIIFSIVGVVCGIWIYGSAIPRLYALVMEADREASQAVVASRPRQFQTSGTAAARQTTQFNTGPSRQDLLRQAVQNAQHPTQP